jgi:hypothetical protein
MPWECPEIGDKRSWHTTVIRCLEKGAIYMRQCCTTPLTLFSSQHDASIQDCGSRTGHSFTIITLQRYNSLSGTTYFNDVI